MKLFQLPETQFCRDLQLPKDVIVNQQQPGFFPPSSSCLFHLSNGKANSCPLPIKARFDDSQFLAAGKRENWTLVVHNNLEFDLEDLKLTASFSRAVTVVKAFPRDVEVSAGFHLLHIVAMPRKIPSQGHTFIRLTLERGSRIGMCLLDVGCEFKRKTENAPLGGMKLWNRNDKAVMVVSCGPGKSFKGFTSPNLQLECLQKQWLLKKSPNFNLVCEISECLRHPVPPTNSEMVFKGHKSVKKVGEKADFGCKDGFRFQHNFDIRSNEINIYILYIQQDVIVKQ